MTAYAAKADSAKELIAAIAAKQLESNSAIVEQSIAFGRLTWRRTKNGEFEVKLEPSI